MPTMTVRYNMRCFFLSLSSNFFRCLLFTLSVSLCLSFLMSGVKPLFFGSLSGDELEIGFYNISLAARDLKMRVGARILGELGLKFSELQRSNLLTLIPC